MAELQPNGVEPLSAGLELENISVSFGGIKAVNDLSLQIRPGEVCGLIGPNGAGKTTLFDVVSGVQRANHGSIRLNSVDLTKKSSFERSRLGLKRTFQRPQVFGWLTVEENVLVATEWRGGGGGFMADMCSSPMRRRRERVRREVVRDTLERCGLVAVRSEYAGSLPIGLARMVEFARAIVDPPRILLLDEPASGLADDEISFLGELIQSVSSDGACTVLLVEHNADFVMSQCERIVVLALGTVLAQGTPATIKADPVVQQAYLGELGSSGTLG